MEDLTTIPLKKTTRDRLKNFGQKGETYDNVVNRLMEIAEHVEFYQSQKKILDEEEFIPFEEI